jgi:CrcB protein
MTNALLVGAGGFLGAISRYAIVYWVGRLLQTPSFPWGVLAVNVVGSLVIGVLAGISEARNTFSEEVRLFLFLGLLGGFTTFSSITNDTMALIRSESYLQAAANVVLSLALGLAAVAIGYIIGKGS